jgi:DNA-binding response OmpR family regulator
MSGQRILIIEDEPDLLRGLEINLKAEGYAVLAAARGDAGLEQALRERPDLVLLDIMLPGMSGLDVCRELRGRGYDAPIIMLTARAEEVDRVVGLEIGADDYVTKPFGIRELMARIRVRLRRSAQAGGSGFQSVSGTLRFGAVEADFSRHEVTRHGTRVDLTGKEFEVLRFLVRHRGEIVTRDRLLEEVWGYEAYPTTRTVDNHILRLRQKLEEDPGDPRYILSVYGEGYKFVG